MLPFCHLPLLLHYESKISEILKSSKSSKKILNGAKEKAQNYEIE